MIDWSTTIRVSPDIVILNAENTVYSNAKVSVTASCAFLQWWEWSIQTHRILCDDKVIRKRLTYKDIKLWHIRIFTIYDMKSMQKFANVVLGNIMYHYCIWQALEKKYDMNYIVFCKY